MITIEYTAQGTPISDCSAERFVQNMLENEIDSGHSQQSRVSTENVIQAALTMKIRDGIDVRFKYKKEFLVPNEYGALHDWPEGFADHCMRSLTERMDLQYKKRKKGKQ